MRNIENKFYRFTVPKKGLSVSILFCSLSVMKNPKNRKQFALTSYSDLVPRKVREKYDDEMKQNTKWPRFVPAFAN